MMISAIKCCDGAKSQSFGAKPTGIRPLVTVADDFVRSGRKVEVKVKATPEPKSNGPVERDDEYYG